MSAGFRFGQIGTASLISLAHGTNDAQKTMGVIFLALVAHGTITAETEMPFWVKFTCAVAIALGTYLGGWRIIRTLGKGLVEIAAPQGLAAEASSAAIILTSSHLGLPPLDHPRRHRIDPRYRHRAQGRRGSAGASQAGWPPPG